MAKWCFGLNFGLISAMWRLQCGAPGGAVRNILSFVQLEEDISSVEKSARTLAIG